MIDDFAAYPGAGQKAIKKQFPHFSKLPIFERCHLFLSERFCFCLVTNLHIFFSKLSVQVSPTSPKVTANFGYTPQSWTWHLNMVASKFRIIFSSGKISRAAMLGFRNWHADERPQASPEMPGCFDQLSPPQLPLPPTSPPMPDNLSINSPPKKRPFFNLKMTDPKMKEVRESHLPRNNLHDLVFTLNFLPPSIYHPLNPPKRYLWISGKGQIIVTSYDFTSKGSLFGREMGFCGVFSQRSSRLVKYEFFHLASISGYPSQKSSSTPKQKWPTERCLGPLYEVVKELNTWGVFATQLQGEKGVEVGKNVHRKNMWNMILSLRYNDICIFLRTTST